MESKLCMANWLHPASAYHGARERKQELKPLEQGGRGEVVISFTSRSRTNKRR